MRDFDVAIIGAGPSGLFSAFRCGLLGMSTVIFDSLSEVGGQLATLYPEKNILDVPGFSKITGFELSQKLKEQADQFAGTYKMSTKITDLQKVGNNFQLTCDNKEKYTVASVIIAAGGGSFLPKKPKLDDIELYEGNSIHYMVKKVDAFKNKNVAIIGGGDSAVDWALQLHHAGANISLIHRRNKFRAIEASVKQINSLANNGEINLYLDSQVTKLIGDGEKLSKITILNNDGQEHELQVNDLLIFMGLNKDLGPIANWQLGESKTRIDVEKASMQTREEGIFAIGDVAHYENKENLIVLGFAEATLASNGAFLHVNPDKKLSHIHSSSMKI